MKPVFTLKEDGKATSAPARKGRGPMRPKAPLATILALILLPSAWALPLVVPSETGLVWRTETISTNAITSADNPGFAIRNDGLVAATWGDVGGGAFYGELTPLGWVTTRISRGLEPSLAFDEAGAPHVIVNPTGKAVHAWRDGSTWVNETIATGPNLGYESDIEIDCGAIYAIYSSFDALYYAVKEGDAWTIETITTNASVLGADLALESDCTPHVTYTAIEASPVGVIHAWKPYGEEWRQEFVSSGGISSIDIDSAGGVHMAFSMGEKLHYAYKASPSAAWSIELADDRFGARQTSIAVDSAGRPHISHEQWINTRNINDPCCGHQLYATKRLDGTWLTSTIDFEGNHDGSTIRVDIADTPRVAYFYFFDQVTGGGMNLFDLRFAEPLASVPARLG